jgi:two-component system sensor histidine kinase RegB
MTSGLLERHASSAPARDHLRQLVLLRAIAIAGQIVTVAFVNSVLDVALPLLPLAAGIGFLAVFNVATGLRLRLRQPVSDGELLAQILADVGAFTVLLYFTGGAANPFASMYVLNIAVAAAVLPRAYTWNVVGVAGAGYLLLAFFNVPLARENGELLHEHHELIAIALGSSFAITAALIAYFLVKITDSLREHQRLLFNAREKELNNERIVQLGALAAGAAHELSTPLATMAVVVKELGTRCDCSRKPELLGELRIVSDQIELCKGALSSLLASAGQTRMDGGGKVALDEFLEALVENCRLMRPKTEVTWRCEGTQPAPEIVVERTLQQAIMNLLNNAADASPDRVDVEGHWNERELCIRICDRGEGIAPGAAVKIGRAFFTTKPAGQGSGVGLVLSRTIIGRFGGSVRLFNQPERGACTEVRLPLAPFLVSVRP